MDKAWQALTAEERQAQRLDAYVNMPGFEFASPEAEARYRERTTIIRDAFQMKGPARVPVIPSEGFFPTMNAGVSMREAMYDYEKVAAAVLAYLPTNTVRWPPIPVAFSCATTCPARSAPWSHWSRCPSCPPSTRCR
jgi:hypothetical protein